MPTQYPSLRIGAARRLAMFRKEAMQPNWIRPMTWRDVRFATLKSTTGFDGGRNSEWYTHNDTTGYFRSIKDAHEIVRSLNQGYYSDVDSSETVIGIVAALSHGRFVAGYRWTSNGETVIHGGIYGDADDAARAADSHAERYAGICREDSYQYREAQKLEYDIEDSFTRLRECIALRNRACMSYVRDEIAELIEKIRDNRSRLSTEFANYV